MIPNHNLIKTSRLVVKTRYFILFKNRHSKAHSLHSKLAAVVTDGLTSVTKQFDSVLGISEVRTAQSLVQTAEEEFMKSRRSVQQTRNELIRLQSHLRELRSKLDRIPREDERYLQLATEEHKALLAERKAKTDLETLEALERDQFSALSGAVRGAHEKERSRAERTKYWSIIASACGAVLGILGSTMINMRRMKQIRLTVQENNDAFIAKTMAELRTLVKSEEITITDKAKTSNDFLALLNENTRMLNVIDSKVGKFSNEELAVSHDLSHDDKNLSNLENSFSLVELDRRIQDLTWWSKAGLFATVASSACFVIYMLAK